MGTMGASLEATADGSYHTMSFGTFTLKPGMYFWFSPCGNPHAAKGVYVDSIIPMPAERGKMIEVDAAFPGGNIIVDSIEGDSIKVRQDRRDTEGSWFYWSFRVSGAAGRDLQVAFTDGNVIGSQGPAVSLDGGLSWNWMGRDSVDEFGFRHSCPSDAKEVRFAFAIPYVQKNLDSFLDRFSGNAALQRQVLCTTPKGRSAEWFRIEGDTDTARHRVLITCRHHCCEMMANYVLEGILESALSSDDLGAWYRNSVVLDAVPFVDKDGVEQGDQGKNRQPRDHGRDYAGESIYSETAAIRQRWLDNSAERPSLVLDLHCPYIRGGLNECIYLVGRENNWEEIGRLSAILESGCSGPLKFESKNNLPFGQDWNTAANYSKGKGIGAAAQDLPGVRLATTIEIPYAIAGGVTVTPDACRTLGHDISAAIRRYLSE